MVATVVPSAATDHVLDLGATSIPSSPAMMPDGSFVLSSYEPPESLRGPSSLFVINPAGQPRVLRSRKIAGQISTAAVADDGTIYAAVDPPGDGAWQLTSWTASLDQRWSVAIAPSPLNSFAPPKIIEVDGKTLIYLPVGGDHLLIVDQAGTVLFNDFACAVYEGGWQIGFHIDPVKLPPPHVEDPAAAIARINDMPTDIYAALAFDRCGVVSFRVENGATGSSQSRLFHKIADISDAFFRSPILSGDGVAIVGVNDGRLVGYDMEGGKRWERQLGAKYDTPDAILFPGGGLNLFAITNDRIYKIGVADGRDVVAANGSGVGQPSVGIDRGHRLVASATHLFATAESGIYTFDLDLSQLGFYPLPMSDVPPALGINGEVIAVDKDWRLHIFRR